MTPSVTDAIVIIIVFLLYFRFASFNSWHDRFLPRLIFVTAITH
jgi:hypothetical protein